MGQEGIKLDSKKPLLYVLLKQFPKAIGEVARCSEYGHEKYKETDKDWQNWKRLEEAEFRYSNALLRHLSQEGRDEDSGLLHAAHTAWNALARLELIIKDETTNTNTKI